MTYGTPEQQADSPGRLTSNGRRAVAAVLLVSFGVAALVTNGSLSATNNVDLLSTEKSAEGVCLDKLYHAKYDAYVEASDHYKAQKGEHYYKSKLDLPYLGLASEEFANAAGVNALDDPEYLKVANAKAEEEDIAKYIKAKSTVQTCDHEDAETRSRYPTLYDLTSKQCAAARADVLEFESNEKKAHLVASCVTVCPPGQGFEKGFCHPCKAGHTWNGLADTSPCKPVITSCPDNHVFTKSTSASKDSTCTAPPPVQEKEEQAIQSDPSADENGVCHDSCMNPSNCHPIGDFNGENFHGAMKCIDCCCGNWEGVWDQEFFEKECSKNPFHMMMPF